MVYMTNGPAESGENLTVELVNLITGCELPFVCMGDWNMAPEEMRKTELMGSTGAVMKTPLGVEFSCSSGHKLMDYALVDRSLESVVKVKSFWAVPWMSRCFANQCSRSTPHAYDEDCVHTAKFPTGEI